MKSTPKMILTQVEEYKHIPYERLVRMLRQCQNDLKKKEGEQTYDLTREYIIMDLNTEIEAIKILMSKRERELLCY